MSAETVPEQFYTTIRCEQHGEEWVATEPNGKQSVEGRGENPRAATIDYVESLE